MRNSNRVIIKQRGVRKAIDSAYAITIYGSDMNCSTGSPDPNQPPSRKPLVSAIG